MADNGPGMDPATQERIFESFFTTKRAQPQAFDLLLTDQTMSGPTGEGLAQAVRALRPGLPVVICTGFSQTLAQERTRELGARLLMKSLTRRQLAQAAREALGPRA